MSSTCTELKSEITGNLEDTCPPLCAYILALHCDNGFLHLQFCLVQTYAAKGHLECDYEGQGTDKVRC